MTTIRLNSTQKRKLSRAVEILGATKGRKVTQGEAVEAMAEFVARHPAQWAEEMGGTLPPLSEDPFFDKRIVFRTGRRTNAKSIDRILYGSK